MKLLYAWKDSLTLFLPQNLKLFVLITLKTIIETYKLLFHFFWWLLLGLIFLTLAIPILNFYSCSAYSPSSSFVHSWLFLMGMSIALFVFVAYVAFTWVCVLTTRPSVECKDWSYFRTYFFFFPKLLLYQFVFVMISLGSMTLAILGIVSLFDYLSDQNLRDFVKDHPYFFYCARYIGSVLVGSICYGVYPLSLFFIGDTKKYVKSFFLALKMVALNFPIFLIIYTCCWLITILLKYARVIIYHSIAIFAVTSLNAAVLRGILYCLFTAIDFCLLPVYFSMMATLYTKRLYEQYDIYCKRS